MESPAVDLESIVRIYALKVRPRAQAELAWFSNQPTLAAAIRTAALALNSQQKRYSHQRRIKRTAIQQSLAILSHLEGPIRKCADFSGLFKLIKDELVDVPGIGELYVYDTALHIGVKFGVFPEKVYLHAGTRIGVRNLRLEARSTALSMASLPRALRRLKPHEVEDVLCIFKDRFGATTHGVRRSWCG
jgi:hypothetical protein